MKPWKSVDALLGGNMKNGRLTYVSESPVDPRYPGSRMGLFKCDCGNEKRTRLAWVRDGLVKSCGCLHSEKSAEMGRLSATHGKSKTAVYRIWRAMINRCNNPKVERYPAYGGRGISVCARWTGPGGFEKFISDIGDRPTEKHSIDRIDVNGNYEPGNVRWADQKTQDANRRNTVMVEYMGERMTMSEASRVSGIGRATLKWRHDNGKPLFAPVR